MEPPGAGDPQIAPAPPPQELARLRREPARPRPRLRRGALPRARAAGIPARPGRVVRAGPRAAAALRLRRRARALLAAGRGAAGGRLAPGDGGPGGRHARHRPRRDGAAVRHRHRAHPLPLRHPPGEPRDGEARQGLEAPAHELRRVLELRAPQRREVGGGGGAARGALSELRSRSGHEPVRALRLLRGARQERRVRLGVGRDHAGERVVRRGGARCAGLLALRRE